MNDSEQPEDAAEDSEELLAFLAIRPTVMHPVIRRHGLELFAFVEQCGIGQWALGEIEQSLQKAIISLQACNAKRTSLEVHKQTTNALGAITQMLNIFAGSVEKLKGLDKAKIIECKTDIERAGALAAAEIQKGKSGIILPN